MRSITGLYPILPFGNQLTFKAWYYRYISSGKPLHLKRYCNEFAARYNSRKISDNERFDIALQNSDGRLKYNTVLS